MQFKGFQKESLIEWPGKICAVVFLSGCNFRCSFCHNRDLVLFPERLPDIDEQEILDHCRENKKLLDGLVITGGEPLIHSMDDLVKFIKRIKALGLKVGIETNGSNPKALTYLIKNKLVDYLAMDIKAPLNQKKYSQIVGTAIDLSKIKKSIKIIINSGFDSEFRTTVVPGLLNKEDILEIAKQIKGAKTYCLQQFQPNNTIERKLENIKPYSKKWFEKTAQEVRKYLTNIELRL